MRIIRMRRSVAEKRQPRPEASKRPLGLFDENLFPLPTADPSIRGEKSV